MKIYYPVFVLSDGRVLTFPYQSSEQEALRVIDFAFDQDRFSLKGKSYHMNLVKNCFIHGILDK